jgi:hypothetical protein
MVSGLLFLVLVAVLVALAVRRMSRHEPVSAPDGHALRRFFQYLVLYGLLVVVCIGLSGLLGRLLERDVVLAVDASELARNLAFTVVGVPVFVGVALWSRRRLAADADEARSLGWAFYVTAASLTSLLIAMTGLGQVLQWATGLTDYNGRGLAAFVVWGVSWGAHWWLDARITPQERSRLHHLAGSLIGLVTAATGLVEVLAGAVRALLDLGGDAVLARSGNAPLQGLVTLSVGATVWVVYWARTAARQERDALWFAYVLLAGVGGGLVTAVAGASTLAYTALVWVLGDPRTGDAGSHFENAPTEAAVAAVGLLLWWYHQALLQRTGARARTEVDRIYEYLMAGIGLLVAAAGFTTAVVALVEVGTGQERVIVGASSVNTFLAAATLLAVGVPVWWVYWRRIQAAAASAPVAELGSTVRRAYLLVLFGLGGVAAVVALLTGVFLFFEDAVDGVLGAETLRDMRFTIGVLVTSASIAAYHWAVYRADRAHGPPDLPAHGPHLVLLVGASDPQLAHEVARRTGGRVQAWSRTDDDLPPLSVDGVMAALEGTTAGEVIVLADVGGVRAIPIHRA